VLLFGDAQQVGAVARLAHRLAQALEVLAADPALEVCDLLEAGDLEPLALLERLDEGAGLEQRIDAALQKALSPERIKKLMDDTIELTKATLRGKVK